MNNEVVLILNKGDLPFYLKELLQSFSSFRPYPVFRYHLKNPKATSALSGNNLGSDISQIPLSDADLLIPEYSTQAGVSSPRYLINLSDTTPPELPWKESMVIDMMYFRNLRGEISPDICRALLQKEPTLTQTVVVHSPLNGRHEINKGTFLLLNYSYSTSLKLITSACIRLLGDALRRLEKGYTGIEVSEEIRENTDEVIDCTSLSRLIKKNLFKHRLQQLLFSYKWNTGIIASPIYSVALSQGRKWTVKWLPEAGGDDFRADPFGFKHNNRLILMFEYFKNGKGALVLSTGEGHTTKILESAHHLSYPYLFCHEEEWYCLPEQHSIGKLILYKYHHEREELTEHRVLLEGFQAVDPSLILFKNKWWLFCTDADQKGADVRLHIFYSDQLTGPYHAHALNPVKTDISSARPGGHLFEKEGNLYRPSQNSSRSYGKELVINRVDLLSENTFKETPVSHLRPEQMEGKYQDGWHTISSCGDYTLVDGKRKYFSPRNLLKLFRKS